MREEGTNPGVRFDGAGPEAERRAASEALDAVFDALADERRRAVLGVVLGRSGWLGLDELADRIHDEDGGNGAGPRGPNDRNRIRCQLYHAHLPKLDEAGLVEFDRTHNAVRPSASGRRRDLCLEFLARADV